MRDAEELREFRLAAEGRLSDAHVSLIYGGAVIRLYAAFERMMIGALTGTTDSGTPELSDTTGIRFPEHLADEVCEYIIIGNGRFNFRARDGLTGEIRKDVPGIHHLVQAVRESGYRTSLDRLRALRNRTAHDGPAPRRNALRSTGRRRMGPAGSRLKRRDRLEGTFSSLPRLSEETGGQAPCCPY